MPETAVVTLLFGDLVGSTELLQTLGDDANDQVRRALILALTLNVEARSGAVVKSAGDGVMAAFRTSAADAVACAIEMQRSAAAIEHDGHVLGLELRIGVSAGEASHEDGDWFGTPVVEAARLESAAQPGQILVSEVVRSLVGTRGGAQFRAAGKRAFKGFPQPVPVVEVVWRDTSAPKPIRRKKRRAPKRRVLIAVVAALTAAAGIGTAIIIATASDSDGSPGRARRALPGAEGYTPIIELRPCPEDAPSDADCETLVVPQDRAHPDRKIRIEVTTYPSRGKDRGVATVTIGGFQDNFSESNIREYGEFVAIDVRGGNLSDPSLACPEIASVARVIMALPMGAEQDALVFNATESCADRLVAEGVDLNQFGTADIAADIRDLAIAKGWLQMNLQGDREWGRAAIEVAQRHPDLVRAVVITNPLPFDAQANTHASRAGAAFKAYVEACRMDEACTLKFPDLQVTFARRYEEFKLNPVTIDVPDPDGGADIPVYVDGDRLGTVLASALGDPGARSLIASTINSDGDGVLTTLAAYVVEEAPLDPATVWGLWNSLYCEDEEPLVSIAGLAAQAAAFPLFSGTVRVADTCAHWPTNGDSVLWNEVRASAVPVLILAGAMNPFSPAAFAEDAARAFSDPIIAVFPTMTSGVIENGPPCVAELRTAFLRDPRSDLAIEDCIAAAPPVEFQGT